MNTFALLTAALLGAIPFMHTIFVSSLSGHDYARLVQLVMLLAMGGVWVARAPVWRRGPWQVRHAAVALLVVLVTLSCLLAVHPWVAAREVVLLGSLLIMTNVLSAPLAETAVRDRFLSVLALGGAAYGLLWATTLVAVSVAGASVSFSPWDLLFGFDNPRFLNHAQTVSLPLAGIVAARADAPRWLRAAALSAIFLGGAILFLYLARATTLGLLIGAIVTALALGRTGWHYIRTFLVAFLGGVVTMALSWHFILRHLGLVVPTEQIGEVHFRDYLVHQAFLLFKSSPWLGVGPMHFAQTMNPVAAHPHNVYAQVLAEYGLPGALLILVLAGSFLARWWPSVRKLASSRPAEAAGLVTATAAMLIDGVFSGNFVMPVSQLWCAVLIALLMAVHRAAATPLAVTEAAVTSPVKHRFQNRLVRSLPVMALLVLTVVSFDEALLASRPYVHTGGPEKQPIGEPFMSPRYWSNGWF